MLGRAGAADVVERLRDPDVAIHAPSTLPVEVMAAVRGSVAALLVTADRRIARVPPVGAVVVAVG